MMFSHPQAKYVGLSIILGLIAGPILNYLGNNFAVPRYEMSRKDATIEAVVAEESKRDFNLVDLNYGCGRGLYLGEGLSLGFNNLINSDTVTSQSIYFLADTGERVLFTEPQLAELPTFESIKHISVFINSRTLPAGKDYLDGMLIIEGIQDRSGQDLVAPDTGDFTEHCGNPKIMDVTVDGKQLSQFSFPYRLSR